MCSCIASAIIAGWWSFSNGSVTWVTLDRAASLGSGNAIGIKQSLICPAALQMAIDSKCLSSWLIAHADMQQNVSMLCPPYLPSQSAQPSSCAHPSLYRQIEG